MIDNNVCDAITKGKTCHNAGNHTATAPSGIETTSGSLELSNWCIL
jgi:hypothetical protein